ncbi:class I SAM-dependent methyltransferase [Ectothiorhodospiraceae bacterium WFHF3C12]|nr:class I SAM-dependent methyltransferase [Ectothiorhodospiraceae bacterium WFHF3C12]
MATPEQPDPRMIAAQLRKPSGDAAEVVGDKMDRVNEPLFRLTLEVLHPAAHERILEIGFGTGTYLERLFAGAEELQVHGIDYSPEMVERASRRNAALVDAGRLHLATGTSEDLPFESEYFDRVFCNMVVYFWDQPEGHLAEIHRILKPGGHFYIGMRTRDSMLQFPFVQHGFVLHEPETWQAILGRSGFSCREAARRFDPVIEEAEGDIHLESVCLDATKL